MDFKDSIKQLASKVAQLKDSLLTEEATKNALIMPFINALGYDVFDPAEVVPEMDCDIAKKKGEKIDYAIMKNGEPIMLIECKHWAQNLSLHETQLQRYFVSSKAKFGILTNGVRYLFYTDTATPNIMDDKPFLDINMEDLRDFQIEELKKFHKSYFDIDNVMSVAVTLKYMSELKSAISKEFQSPSEAIVRHLCKPICKSPFTQKLIEQFTPIVRQALNSYVNDLISDRLKAAMGGNEGTEESGGGEIKDADTEAGSRAGKIETTEEELAAYYTVKAILHDTIPGERVTYRDAVTYFAIFADDNNRKPICRLYFNERRKRIAFIEEDKSKTEYVIESLDDLYGYADELKKSASRYV